MGEELMKSCSSTWLASARPKATAKIENKGKKKKKNGNKEKLFNIKAIKKTQAEMKTRNHWLP